jgi:hypothetical protein
VPTSEGPAVGTSDEEINRRPKDRTRKLASGAALITFFPKVGVCSQPTDRRVRPHGTLSLYTQCRFQSILVGAGASTGYVSADGPKGGAPVVLVEVIGVVG